MKPEDLIGPAAAKALAEHYDLTPKAKPLAEVVTEEDTRWLFSEYRRVLASPCGSLAYDSPVAMQLALSEFVLRWARGRFHHSMEAMNFTALTGREWTP